MSGPMSERWPNLVTIPIGTLAATATVPGIPVRKASKIKNAYIIDQAGVAADNTNYLQVGLQDTANSPIVYASLDTRAAHEGALTANVPLNMTLTAALVTDGEVRVEAGVTLQVVCTKNGTGVPTKAVLVLEMYPL